MAIKVSMNARKTTNTLSLIILCDLISIIIPDVQYWVVYSDNKTNKDTALWRCKKVVRQEWLPNLNVA